MNSRAMAETCRGAAQSHRQLGEYDAAIEKYEEAIGLEKDNPYNYLERGYCYREKYNQGDKKASYLRSAIEDFNKAKDLFAISPE